MIIGTRSSDFIKSDVTVDSSAVSAISGRAAGESFYPVGGRFQVSQNIKRQVVVERHPDVIIERYFITPIEFGSGEPVWCEVLTRIIPCTEKYNDGHVIVLLNKQSIQRALLYFNQMDMSVEFFNTYLFKSVIAECGLEGELAQDMLEVWLLDAASNKNRFLTMEEGINWNVAPFYNYPNQATRRMDPYQISIKLDEAYSMMCRNQTNPGLLLAEVEDIFIPRAERLFPSYLSNKLISTGALSKKDLLRFVDHQHPNTLITADLPFKEFENIKNTHFITEYVDAWADLCEACQYLRHSDLSFEYILPRWKLLQFSNRYGIYIADHHNQHMIRLITDIVCDKLFPGVRHFRFYKTYDHMCVVEILENNKVVYRYSADLVLAAVINQALVTK